MMEHELSSQKQPLHPHPTLLPQLPEAAGRIGEDQISAEHRSQGQRFFSEPLHPKNDELAPSKVARNASVAATRRNIGVSSGERQGAPSQRIAATAAILMKLFRGGRRKRTLNNALQAPVHQPWLLYAGGSWHFKNRQL